MSGAEKILEPSSVKSCSKCGVEYPHTAEFFHVDRRMKCGLTRQCKECRRKATLLWNRSNKDRYNENWRRFYHANRLYRAAKSKTWYHDNKERARDRRLKRDYGITKEEYTKLMARQGEVCAICGRHA